MHKVISRDGTPIAYDRAGTGPALILVGGAFQQKDNPGMTGLAAELADRFTVYCHDRRGRGASGDTAPYTVEREIEDLAALIELAGGRAALFGMSSGAMLALRAAKTLPVTKLALFEPPVIVDDSRPGLPADYVATLESLAPADAIEYFMTTAVGMPAGASAMMSQTPFWPTMLANARTLAYDGRVMADSMSGRPLGPEWSVDTETLVMAGAGTWGWIHAGTKALAAVLPHGRHAVVPGGQHQFEPAELAPILADFFS